MTAENATEVDDLLEDDGPSFPAYGRLSFHCDPSDNNTDEEQSTRSGRSSSSCSLNGLHSFEQGEEPDGGNKHVEEFHIVDRTADAIPLHFAPKIVGAAIVGDIKHYVEYTILLNYNGHDLNMSDCAIRRRFSDFCSLHVSLLKHHDSHMTGIVLPPKVWFGNLSPSLIEKRRQALEVYLAAITSNIILRQSQPFVSFCSYKEVSQASAMTKAMNYEQAHCLFQKAFIAQSELLGTSHPIVVETCCYLAAVNFQRGLLEEVARYSEMALKVLERENHWMWLPPLVRLMIRTYRGLDRVADATRLELWLGQLRTSAYEKSLLQLAADI